MPRTPNPEPQVRNLYELTLARQATRVLQGRADGLDPDKFQILRQDLLGPKELDESRSSALKELKAMRGLHSIKQKVRVHPFCFAQAVKFAWVLY